MSKKAKKAKKAAKPYKSKYPLPTEKEREMLTILMEECAEVIQRASKLLRFGRDEKQEGQKLTNSARLSREAGQLACMIDECEELALVDIEQYGIGYEDKAKKLRKYLQVK